MGDLENGIMGGIDFFELFPLPLVVFLALLCIAIVFAAYGELFQKHNSKKRMDDHIARSEAQNRRHLEIAEKQLKMSEEIENNQKVIINLLLDIRGIDTEETAFRIVTPHEK